MNRLFAILVGAVCLLGGGCLSSQVAREEPVTVSFGDVELETTALVEALLAQKGTHVQAVNAQYKEDGFQAQCVRKSDGEKLTVVFLAPQMRLVTITVTKPHAIQYERAPQIPSVFEPEYALTDLAFVNLPVATLRKALGSALRVEETEDARQFWTPDGRLVAELRTDIDGARIYRNAVFGYLYQLSDL